MPWPFTLYVPGTLHPVQIHADLVAEIRQFVRWSQEPFDADRKYTSTPLAGGGLAWIRRQVYCIVVFYSFLTHNQPTWKVTQATSHSIRGLLLFRKKGTVGWSTTLRKSLNAYVTYLRDTHTMSWPRITYLVRNLRGPLSSIGATLRSQDVLMWPVASQLDWGRVHGAILSRAVQALKYLVPTGNQRAHNPADLCQTLTWWDLVAARTRLLVYYAWRFSDADGHGLHPTSFDVTAATERIHVLQSVVLLSLLTVTPQPRHSILRQLEFAVTLCNDAGPLTNSTRYWMDLSDLAQPASRHKTAYIYWHPQYILPLPRLPVVMVGEDGTRILVPNALTRALVQLRHVNAVLYGSSMLFPASRVSGAGVVDLEVSDYPSYLWRELGLETELHPAYVVPATVAPCVMHAQFQVLLSDVLVLVGLERRGDPHPLRLFQLRKLSETWLREVFRVPSTRRLLGPMLPEGGSGREGKVVSSNAQHSQETESMYVMHCSHRMARTLMCNRLDNFFRDAYCVYVKTGPDNDQVTSCVESMPDFHHVRVFAEPAVASEWRDWSVVAADDDLLLLIQRMGFHNYVAAMNASPLFSHGQSVPVAVLEEDEQRGLRRSDASHMFNPFILEQFPWGTDRSDVGNAV
jgi:hypothetical protein